LISAGCYFACISIRSSRPRSAADSQIDRDRHLTQQISPLYLPLSSAFAERAGCLADQDLARKPALQARPERVACEQPGDRTAGECHHQIRRNARHLEQKPEDEHPQAGRAARGIDELRQEREEEQQLLGVQQVCEDPLSIQLGE
jgi:hypothetical protein